MKNICFITVFSVFYHVMLIGQAESYDLQFPYKGYVTEMTFDSLGYLWIHDNIDFHRFNGHQFDAVELSSIIDTREDNYVMYNRIIFNEDSLLFTYKKHISTLHPQTKVFKDIWDLPDKYYLSYLYQDELGHLWAFAASWNNLERPVFKSEDGNNFKQVLDLNEIIGEQSIHWDFSELNDIDGNLYFQWRLGDLLIINPSGQPIELEVEDMEEYESTRACSQFRLDNNKNLWRIYGKQFEIYNPSLKIFEAQSISGKIEFITQCKIDQASSIQESENIDLGSFLNLRSIFEDSDGRIWMGCAASYLVCYDPTNDQIFNLRNQIVETLEAGDGDIKKIIEDKDGNIWGMNRGGLFKIRKKYNHFEKFLINTKDKNHPIYAEKENSPILKKVFERYNNYAYKNSTIHTIEEDDEGNLILQTDILSYKINSKNEVEILPLLGPKESVFLSYNNQLKLFGVWNSYYKVDDDYNLQKLNEEILKIENYYIQKNGDIWLYGLLNQSNYLFGKVNKDSYEFEGNYQEQNRDSSFLMKKVNAMSEDNKGNLLLGTTIGLFYLDTKSDEMQLIGNKFFYLKDTIEIGQCIDQVHFIDGDYFWFLTQYELGLASLKDKTIKHLSHLDGNSIEQNLSFLSFGDSVVWVAKNDGIIYHDFKNDNSIGISKSNGLDTKGAILSLKALSNERIAIGTNNGLYVFNPDSLLISLKRSEIKERNYPLYFEGYSVIDATTDSLTEYNFMNSIDQEIVFNYNDKMLNFKFSLINFNYPKGNSYSYKLEGYDSEWTTPSNNNEIIYTSLPSGDYNLKVKASGVSGVWSDNSVTIPLRVKKAWFRTYWFIASCCIFLGGSIYLLTFIYYNQKIKRREELEKLRHTISNDLHDDVGSILAGLSMQTEVLSMDENTELKEQFSKISKSSRLAMIKMRDIVWAMDSTRDKYENLIIRMKNFAQEQVGTSAMIFSFDVDEIDGTRFIPPNIRQNLYLVFKEAITNALKHSTGDKILVSLKMEKKQLNLRIKDNGTAYDQSKSEGLGLASMRNRASKIGAKLEVFNDDGYEVRVSLKV